MFRFTRKPSSGSHRHYLAKIAHVAQCGYVEFVKDVIIVMAACYGLWGVCAQHTENVFYELYVSTLNQVCNFS